MGLVIACFWVFGCRVLGFQSSGRKVASASIVVYSAKVATGTLRNNIYSYES